MRRCFRDSTFNRFDAILVCDGRTDGQTDGQTHDESIYCARITLTSRVKNDKTCFLKKRKNVLNVRNDYDIMVIKQTAMTAQLLLRMISLFGLMFHWKVETSPGRAYHITQNVISPPATTVLFTANCGRTDLQTDAGSAL